MSNLNKVMLMGNLTRDPEIRHTAKGSAVGEIGMAINRKTKDANGNLLEETTFLDVTLWGTTAENAGKYLTKGRLVFVEGRLLLDSWDDKTTGQKRYKLKVVADTLTFLPSGKGGERSGEDAPPRRERAAPAGTTAGGPVSYQDGWDKEDEDDIPF